MTSFWSVTTVMPKSPDLLYSGFLMTSTTAIALKLQQMSYKTVSLFYVVLLWVPIPPKKHCFEYDEAVRKLLEM